MFTPLMTPSKRCFSVKPLINIFSTCSTHQEHFTIMLVKWFNKMQVPGSLHWTILAYSHSVIYPCLKRLCLTSGWSLWRFSLLPAIEASCAVCGTCSFNVYLLVSGHSVHGQFTGISSKKSME